MSLSKNEKNESFEKLTQELIAKNPYLTDNVLKSGEKLSILKAIEDDRVTEYVEASDDFGDGLSDTIHNLTKIYEELGKENPDENFLTERMQMIQESFKYYGVPGFK
jgi:hypothetical protein